jgi:hypothetical protein
MTNTQRVTTVRKDSADTFAHSGNSDPQLPAKRRSPFFLAPSSPVVKERHKVPAASSDLPSSMYGMWRRVTRFQQIVHSRPSVVLLDNDAAHAATLADRLRARQLALTTLREPKDALRALHREPSGWDIVVVNVSDASQPWLAILRRLLEACFSHSAPHAPLFVCTSRIKRDPQFQLALERLGVRFVHER